jgi:D-serine deaminase-like pyridoxal phosphate-dependent protein
MEPSATPSVVIDLATVKRNIARLAEYGRAHRIGIRPQTKTHKSVEIARLQMSAGAVGLTVAKLGEAGIMAQAADDIFIAYPALDAHRTSRIAALARDRKIRVGIDSAAAAEAIGRAANEAGVTVGVLVDLDVGFHRTGVQSARSALELAASVSKQKGLRFDGVMCFPGQIKEPADRQSQALASIAQVIQDAVDEIRKAGFDVQIVSGGSSPSAFQSHAIPALTEIRPGTYVYNDMNMVSGGFCEVADCAARVACTVVSDAVPEKFVIDAGSKTLTSDRRMIDPESAGFGHVVEYPQARIVRLSEEHGEVDASACDRRPRLGERVHVIPNHICPCINLHDTAWLRLEDGALRPLPIDARGMVQ